MFEMTHNRTPFKGMDVSEIKEVVENRRIGFDEQISSKVRGLVYGMLRKGDLSGVKGVSTKKTGKSDSVRISMKLKQGLREWGLNGKTRSLSKQMGSSKGIMGRGCMEHGSGMTDYHFYTPEVRHAKPEADVGKKKKK